MNRNSASTILVAAFAALLCLPGAAMLVRDRQSDAAPLSLPHLESSFNENFGLRRTLIRADNRLRLAIFGESPVRGVVLGRAPWLFYADEWAMEDFENRLPYSEADLEDIRRILEERREWLAARGIRFLVVVAPNKHTVYGEDLPERYAKARPDSRLDQAAAHLAEHSDVEFLDLRSALGEAKAAGRVYDHTDTHWNDAGGFAGSQAILARLGSMLPGVEGLSPDDYALVEETGPGGDLARLLSLPDVYREKRLVLKKRTPPLAKPGTRDYQDPATIPERAMVVRETGNRNAPRALVFRDSFAWKLIPFLSEKLESAVYVWDHRFFPEIVAREKPDVVILECVERYLNALTLENPERVRREVAAMRTGRDAAAK